MPPLDSVRADAFLFYSMAISSFIESTTPEYVVNLARIFDKDPQMKSWLEGTWQLEEVGHGQLMRERVERLWPEFDFTTAYESFTRRYVPRCDASLLRPTPALEALARCVTEAQAAASYRALASYTQDAALAETFLGMAADEARHYAYFRRAFDRHNEGEKQGSFKRIQVVVARTLLVQDEDLALAFASLNDHWKAAPPFVREADYAAYLRLVRYLMPHHFPVIAATRMLLKPVFGGTWLETLATSTVPDLLRRQFLDLAEEG
jgi:rubrerythrin